MSLAAKLFDRLPGAWKLSREIPGKGRLEGKVSFTPSGQSSLEYREDGVLSISHGGKFNSSRSYVYKLNGGRIEIHYDDPHRKNEIMHELDFDAEGKARHRHRCGEDFYEIVFAFESEDRIRIEYDVRGPQKNYRMVSLLQKIIQA